LPAPSKAKALTSFWVSDWFGESWTESLTAQPPFGHGWLYE
jgi:hypothetical protein